MELCAPALIYIIFSLTQIIFDTIKGLYNTAFLKCILAFMVTILLNVLCESGLGVISWIIVFIPFILMSVIITMILYIFGLDAASGLSIQKDKLNKYFHTGSNKKNITNNNNNILVTKSGYPSSSTTYEYQS